MSDGRAALKASRANITSPVACRVLHTARGWNACSTLSQRLERVLPPCHVRHHRCQNFSSIDIRLESEPPKRTKRKIKNKETWLQQNLHSLFSRAIVFCSILCIKAVLEFVFWEHLLQATVNSLEENWIVWRYQIDEEAAAPRNRSYLQEQPLFSCQELAS
jgi:hypothetical protein